MRGRTRGVRYSSIFTTSRTPLFSRWALSTCVSGVLNEGYCWFIPKGCARIVRKPLPLSGSASEPKVSRVCWGASSPPWECMLEDAGCVSLGKPVLTYLLCRDVQRLQCLRWANKSFEFFSVGFLWLANGRALSLFQRLLRIE